ncbi:hypothetical protein ANCDUO_05471 [Ancylostoma duodenale]|uniref:Mos1 transposase HTH domain-containing protein n=1 Tax=Ancylostoma duodenale TaxID=51022 RepID=A0A0C2GYL3_9BILA|nr:hypothetical protein ANCDUO_05471 [Ancylostoma duodenale]
MEAYHVFTFEAFILRAKLVKPSLALPLTDDVLPKSIIQGSYKARCEDVCEDMTDLKCGIGCSLLYDFKRGKTAAESHRDLYDVFGQYVISERQCQRWFHKFRSGYESLEDDARSRPPSVVDMKQLKEAIEEDPSQTTRVLANRLQIEVPRAEKAVSFIADVERA